MPDVTVAVSAAAIGFAPAPHVSFAVPARGGFRLSDSVVVTHVRGESRDAPFRIDSAMLRWLLTSEGRAAAAWLA